MPVGRLRGQQTLTRQALAHLPHADPALQRVEIWGWGPDWAAPGPELCLPCSPARLLTLLPRGGLMGRSMPRRIPVPKSCPLPPAQLLPRRGFGEGGKKSVVGLTFLAPGLGAENGDPYQDTRTLSGSHKTDRGAESPRASAGS